jgi:hypothetical protein
VQPNGPVYGNGAASGRFIGSTPAKAYGRLDRATIAWQGGPQGLDRPLDRAFISAQRRVGRRWRTVDTDLGLGMLWKVDANGRHDAQWEIPLWAPKGIYRLVVTAKRYRIESHRFRVQGAITLRAVPVPTRSGRVAVRIDYPAAKRDIDLTSRPASANGGSVVFRVGNRNVRVKKRRGTTFSVRAPAGRAVSIARGRARDRYGNWNAAAVRLR